MQTLEVLKTLITYPTITPKECGIYEFIKAFLPDFEVLELNKNNVKKQVVMQYLSQLFI